VYRTGWHTVCRDLAEDADDVFFSVVSYIMKINETTMVMNCDADAMNVGYSYIQ